VEIKTLGPPQPLSLKWSYRDPTDCELGENPGRKRKDLGITLTEKGRFGNENHSFNRLSRGGGTS